MSTKKRFTIASDLANGLRNTIQSAANNQGQLHYDMMPLEMIKPDPNNPRRLSLSREEIMNGISEAEANAVKQDELNALTELAQSIKKIGIKNAIEVYKEGSHYQIITGERRYWAAIIAGQQNVPVKISQKPDEFNLRYTQWVENINRQDLSLAEKFHNLQLMADAYDKSEKGPFSERILQSLLGISTIQAYRYICLLKAEQEIISLVKSGKINNLKLIQELVAMKDKKARSQILSWIHSSKSEITNLSHYKQASGKKSSTKKQNSFQINLGTIKGIPAAKTLLEILLSHPRLSSSTIHDKQIDWTSSKSIKNAFQVLFKKLELECVTLIQAE